MRRYSATLLRLTKCCAVVKDSQLIQPLAKADHLKPSIPDCYPCRTLCDPSSFSNIEVKEGAAMIRDMTCEEGSEVCINKTQNLLSKAQMLMRDIQELLDWCTPKGPSVQTRHRMIQQNFQASIEEDGETLVIEGFRFESAVSREDLRRLK